MQNTSLEISKHKTNIPDKDAIENKKNWTYLDEAFATYLTIEGGIKGLSLLEHSMGTPTTYYNDWPEGVTNDSVLRYIWH